LLDSLREGAANLWTAETVDPVLEKV
jgi:hypothetical protein